MKQLGFNTAQIGLATLLGGLNLLIPLCLLLGEKFRARKTVLLIVAFGLSVCCVLPLLSLIVPALRPECSPTILLTSSTTTQQIVLRNASVHSKYANNTSNQFTSKYRRILPHLTSTNTAPLRRKLRNRYLKSPKNIIYQSNLSTSMSASIQDSVRTNGSSHTNYSSYPTHSIGKSYNHQPSLSALFLVLTLSRSPLLVFEHTNLALANLATITYLKGENANYGVYFMWSNIGTALSICIVAGLAWVIRISICGVQQYGYFIAFIWGIVMTLLSMLSLPWFKFEYNEKKSFNWSGVKSDVFNAHYIFMFIVLLYTGLCLSFQTY